MLPVYRTVHVGDDRRLIGRDVIVKLITGSPLASGTYPTPQIVGALLEIRFGSSRLERLLTRRERVAREYGSEVSRAIAKTLNQISRADTLTDLRRLHGLHLEMLEPRSLREYSVRINRQWRLHFRLEEEQSVIVVMEVSKHYER